MPDTDHDTSPLAVLELAAAAVRFVQQNLKIELDFTADTLPLLDHYLDASRADAKKNDELTTLITSAAGAYLGEVVRRTYPTARWHLDPGDHSGWRIELEHVFLSFNPIGMAREALAQASEEGWNAHLEMLEADRRLVAQTLERMGEAAEDDYYRLTTRFEVIEHAIATLEGAAQSRNEAGRRYGADAYAAVLGERAPASKDN